MAQKKKSSITVPQHETSARDLPITRLDQDPVNPVGRTGERALHKLKEDVAENGILSECHVIPTEKGRYQIVDGHRRIHIARELGISKVHCRIHHLDIGFSGALWSSLSRGTRAVNAYEWMEVWYKSGGTMFIPPSVKHQIDVCLQIFGGRSGVKYLLDNGVAPKIGRTINTLLAQFERTTIRTSTPVVVGKWLVENKGMLSFVQSITFSGQPIPCNTLSKLSAKIRNNLPMDIGKLNADKFAKLVKEELRDSPN